MELIRCKAFWWIVAALVLVAMQDADAKSYNKEVLYGDWELVVGCHEEEVLTNKISISKDQIESRLDSYPRVDRKGPICISKSYASGFTISYINSERSDPVEILSKDLIIFSLRAFKRAGVIERKADISGLLGKWESEDEFRSKLDIRDGLISSGGSPLFKIMSVVRIGDFRLIKALGESGVETYSFIFQDRNEGSIAMFVGAPFIMQGPTVFSRKL